MTDPTSQTQTPTKAGTSSKKQAAKTKSPKTTTKKEVEDHLTAQEFSEAPISAPKKIAELLDEDTQTTLTQEAPKVVTTQEELRFAIGQAQVSKRMWVEVDANMFERLLNGTVSPYIMMSAVRVYLKGTREAIEKDEKKAAF